MDHPDYANIRETLEFVLDRVAVVEAGGQLPYLTASQALRLERIISAVTTDYDRGFALDAGGIVPGFLTPGENVISGLHLRKPPPPE